MIYDVANIANIGIMTINLQFQCDSEYLQRDQQNDYFNLQYFANYTINSRRSINIHNQKQPSKNGWSSLLHSQRGCAAWNIDKPCHIGDNEPDACGYCNTWAGRDLFCCHVSQKHLWSRVSDVKRIRFAPQQDMVLNLLRI